MPGSGCIVGSQAERRGRRDGYGGSGGCGIGGISQKVREDLAQLHRKTRDGSRLEELFPQRDVGLNKSSLE